MQQPTRKTFTFPKAEHLCLRNDIEALFSPGSTAATVYPLRAVFRSVPYSGKGPRVKVLLSVPKRHLRHAVDRNRAKRQLREAYRKNKHLLLNALPDDTHVIHLGLLWLSNGAVDSTRVEKSVVRLLHLVGEKATKANAATPKTPSE